MKLGRITGRKKLRFEVHFEELLACQFHCSFAKVILIAQLHLPVYEMQHVLHLGAKLPCTGDQWRACTRCVACVLMRQLLGSHKALQNEEWYTQSAALIFSTDKKHPICWQSRGLVWQLRSAFPCKLIPLAGPANTSPMTCCSMRVLFLSFHG